MTCMTAHDVYILKIYNYIKMQNKKRSPSCCSWFIQDCLDHSVLINVWPMMYMSGAYNVLFLPELLFDRLQTLAQWSLCFGQVCYDFSKSYVMFFGICSGFSGSLCGSMLAHWCTCRKKPMNESWPVNIRAHCQRRQDGLHPLSTLYM